MPDLAHRRTPRRAILLLTLAAMLPGLAACDDGPGQRGAQAATPAPRPVEVTVLTLRQQAAPVNTVLPGRTTAFQVAEVRPQVGGVLRERLFTEGQEVAAGQPLFRIDPAPFQAALETAEASLAPAGGAARRRKRRKKQRK